MAKRRAKRSAKKGMRKAITKRGKVGKGATMSTVISKLNAMESRVDVLEHNDAATYGLLTGMVNASRKARGVAPIKHLPGFVTPRLYRGGYGLAPAAKALGSGKRKR